MPNLQATVQLIIFLKNFNLEINGHRENMTALLKQMKCDISFYSTGIYFNQLSLQWEGPIGILNYANRRYSLHIRERGKQKLWRQE